MLVGAHCRDVGETLRTQHRAEGGAEDGGSPPLRDKQLLIVGGKGKVTGELPFCFNGAPGPCGWIVEGKHTGTPIRFGTFFAATDDGNAASPRRCVPATYSGLLSETPTDQISHVAEGQVCPTGAGGYVFPGRFDGVSSAGRFSEIMRAPDLSPAKGHALCRIVQGLRDSTTA